MQKSDRKRLEEKLAALTGPERQRLYKLAAKMRKAALTKSPRRTTDLTREFREHQLDEQTPAFEKRRGPKAKSLDEWVLDLIEKDQAEHITETTPDTPSQLHSGIVLSTKAGRCQLLFEHRQYEALLRPELTVAQRSDLTINDTVDFSLAPDGAAIVEQVHPRKSTLSRPDPHDPRLERLIAANIEQATIVSSVKAPPLNTYLIDRYLLAVERGGIKPLLCLNKIDLIHTPEENRHVEQKLAVYQALNIPIVRCSALSGEGIDDLVSHLAGQTAVFVGHSGVGKTSLINTIHPDLTLPIGPIRRKPQKGSHTTVRSNLYELPHNIRLIDTPGTRGFGLWKMSPEELRWYFPEFEPIRPDCKFSNCSHTHEPDCAVRQAVDEGNILPARYRSYCRILDSLKEQT